jgi:SAM-dependent methyltransferase
MIYSIYHILTTTNPNLISLKWTLILAIILLLLLIYRSLQPKTNSEGFQQKEPFVMKRNEDTMDMFYAELYDSLHDVSRRADSELIHIINTTSPSTNQSVFLDVGSGTGYVVNELAEAGYTAYGIDKSKAMVEYAQSMYPDIEVLNGDILEPMSFEKGTFTHVLCTYFTVYNFRDKKQFFRNCYHWMQPGGYLILHLVDKDNFERIIPHKMAVSSRRKESTRSKVRINAIFDDFEYIGNYDISSETPDVTFTETMTDLETKHIRQNEITYHMEDIETILEYAKVSGFLYHAKTDMHVMNGDAYQYLYYFERPL